MGSGEAPTGMQEQVNLDSGIDGKSVGERVSYGNHCVIANLRRK